MSEIEETTNAVAEICKAVPIYQDAVQPAAKQIGQSLETIAKTVNLALSPVSGLVWGGEKIKDWVSTKVAEKLRDVPPENIVSPRPNVAGPLLESMRYTGHEEALRDMYANLLASSMNKNTSHRAHPSYVEVIKQLTSDEARLLSYIGKDCGPIPLLTLRAESKDESGGQDVIRHISLLGKAAECEVCDNMPVYIDNLCRLGLIVVSYEQHFTAPGIYDELEQSPIILAFKELAEKDNDWEMAIKKGGIWVTELGKQFSAVCVQPALRAKAE